MLNGYLLIILAAIGYGALPIFIKWGFNMGLTIDVMLFSRFFIASSLMVFILFVSRKKGFKISKSSFIQLALQGFLFFGCSYTYFLSIKHMSVIITNILLYTYPLMVVLMSALIFKEKISFVKGATLLIAFFGCLLVIDVTNMSGQKISMSGLFYAVVSALFYALYNINGQYLSEKSSPFTVSVCTTIICLFATIAIYPPINVISCHSQLALWTVGLGTAMLCTGVPLFCYQKGLSLLGASRASILSTIEPAITTLLASFLLGETLTSEQLLGGLLIICGGLLLKLDKLKKPYPLNHHLSH
ncbi:DMT family transporter [Desulfosporosinus sp. FKA]|uniref:DMT family transporter n=1 Tax=Desulfosporosinus sp. FKA TaxID=1969834 RepID=UPI000B4A110C|nr:DMT family transporter [Desulfosporosinus sp. FKA]